MFARCAPSLVRGVVCRLGCRNAGIEACTECQLWALDRATFRRVIVRAAARVVTAKVDFLKRCGAGGLAAAVTRVLGSAAVACGSELAVTVTVTFALRCVVRRQCVHVLANVIAALVPYRGGVIVGVVHFW